MTAPARATVDVEYVGGPRCGGTESVELLDGEVPVTLHARYVHAGPCYPADFHVARCPTVSGRHRYEWEYMHTGRRSCPSKPCCRKPRPGCPYWTGGAGA